MPLSASWEYVERKRSLEDGGIWKAFRGPVNALPMRKIMHRVRDIRYVIADRFDALCREKKLFASVHRWPLCPQKQTSLSVIGMSVDRLLDSIS
jgi:hypothetical protein